MNGIALILSGASGTGKSTILGHFKKLMPHVAFSVSCTTRTPRPNEIEGVDYYFLTLEQFKQRLDNHEFIEYAEVHGNFYGTLKTEITDRVRAQIDVILDIDVQGAQSIRTLSKTDPLLAESCLFLFIAPPSFEELERRLKLRGTETEASLEKRLKNAKHELTFWRTYDYLIVNDDAEKSAHELEAIFITLKRQTTRMRKAPFNV